MAFVKKDIINSKDYTNTTTLTDLINLVKENLKKNIHVSTLAFFKSWVMSFDNTKGYGIILVKPFPLEIGQENYEIEAYCFTKNNYASGDIVTVMFADNDFSTCLELKEIREKTNKAYHSNNFGIVVSSSNPLERISGYDATKTQVLKNNNGSIVWVTEEE